MHRKLRIQTIGRALGLLVTGMLSTGLAVAADLQLTDDVRLQLASVEEGAAAITAEDEFVRSLSRFDLQARLKTDGEATVAQWQKFVAGEVRPWQPDQIKPMAAAVERLRPKLERLNLPLPKTILLVRTTGQEEAHAAYTRGTAIVLPDKVLAYEPAALDRLLVHELFHILSRQHPMLRSELYALIGFQLCPPIELPEMLADRKLTNPDAPLVDCFIEIADGDKTYSAAPVLYASTKEYDAKAGGSMFKYLTFRLLVIEKRDGAWQPAMKGEQPVVIDPKNLPAFFEQIGRNTNYIIHPDEILADNFVHLVMGNQNLQTPRIVERMLAMLAK
ncbi:MAG: hypothetical protein WD872_21480 [Pirellulaceae bacterium]